MTSTALPAPSLATTLIRRGLGGPAMRVDRNPRNGLPVVRLGRPVTFDDVRSLDDEA